MRWSHPPPRRRNRAVRGPPHGLRRPSSSISFFPTGSGIEVCRELRTWLEAPVIVLSAVGEERDKVEALDAGADDYVTKPFGIDELLARLRAALRRATAPRGTRWWEIGELRIDLDSSGSWQRNGDARVRSRRTSSPLLRYLAQNEGRLLTHRSILREVWYLGTRPNRTICTSTSPSCAGRSSPIRRGRATY